MRKTSKDYSKLLTIEKCGAGGESLVLIGDVPGIDVVIKMPVPNKDGTFDAEGAMGETHLIEYAIDHLYYSEFIVKAREELIIRQCRTKKILFYCSYYDRIRLEMGQGFEQFTNVEDYLEFRDKILTKIIILLI